MIDPYVLSRGLDIVLGGVVFVLVLLRMRDLTFGLSPMREILGTVLVGAGAVAKASSALQGLGPSTYLDALAMALFGVGVALLLFKGTSNAR